MKYMYCNSELMCVCCLFKSHHGEYSFQSAACPAYPAHRRLIFRELEVLENYNSKIRTMINRVAYAATLTTST